MLFRTLTQLFLLQSAWKRAVAETYLASEPSVEDIPGPKCTISLSGCFCSSVCTATGFVVSSVGWASAPVQAGCAGNLAVLLPPATCLCSGLHLCDLAVTALILSLLSWQNGAYKSKRSRNARGRRRRRRDQTSSAVQSWCSRRPGAWLSRATAAGSSAARKSS